MAYASERKSYPLLFLCHRYNTDYTSQVYIVPLEGGSPRELTSGQQGATHNPVFDASGSKVAWLELEKDGHESDRYVYCHFEWRSGMGRLTIRVCSARVVIYDLEKNVRYTLTQPWDRSPDGLAVRLLVHLRSTQLH